ncbi:MAG: antitoxin [Alphaproteobacteria bacterium CG_4_10_14_0_2_um_filter_63_37]|nr:MAG: hypothetical protein AUJ55_04645 [Proteobacteria bacterium CG1_02_64_396]PJA24627.1 MAG: antitoxin [Alphaproteobacteria bacterium CG_4_10_14_0_2_um_filter_63_37]
MQTKLTLRLDDALIEQAKNYGKGQGKSVSQLVAEYFQLLGSAASSKQQPQEALPPRIRSLKGLILGSQITEEDYREHQIQKHLGS